MNLNACSKGPTWWTSPCWSSTPSSGRSISSVPKFSTAFVHTSTGDIKNMQIKVYLSTIQYKRLNLAGTHRPVIATIFNGFFKQIYKFETNIFYSDTGWNVSARRGPREYSRSTSWPSSPGETTSSRTSTNRSVFIVFFSSFFLGWERL